MALTGSRYDSLQVDHLVFGCPERRLLRVLHGGMISEMGGHDQTPRLILADATAKQARHRAVPLGQLEITGAIHRSPSQIGHHDRVAKCPRNGHAVMAAVSSAVSLNAAAATFSWTALSAGAGDAVPGMGSITDAAGADAVREQHAASAALACGERRNMPISNRDISSVLTNYLKRYPEEAALLSEPLWLLP